MRALIARDLADAQVAGLSVDRRFATAYNAALLATHMGAAKYADYFDTCRRKRNLIDYTRSSVATETEAREIVKKATEFHEFVEAWIETNFPNLKR